MQTRKSQTMDAPPPPYQAIAPAPSNSLHIPISQRGAKDTYKSSPSRPATPSPSAAVSEKSLHHHLITQNLWQEAVEKLPEKDKKSLEIPKRRICDKHHRRCVDWGKE
jgi:hypothetical protein